MKRLTFDEKCNYLNVIYEENYLTIPDTLTELDDDTRIAYAELNPESADR